MSGTVHSSRTGIALVMVILILAGLLAIAVPLVYICRSNETSAARTLDQEIARRYALSALELAKGQLRRGTYENEFRATYPQPTAAPTPTPANAANLAPYNTPDYDAAPELIVPQAELDKAIPKVLPNGDTLSVSVEVEDEQGKLNLNSITPRLLRGLYMAVFRIDPKDLSADDRAALKARFEHLIDPIAMLRFSSGTYTPLRSVEQIRNFSTTDSGTTYQLTETEYEAMRPFLTVHSWRPSADGFVRETEIKDLRQEPQYDFSVYSYDCRYRAQYFDDNGAILVTRFLMSDRVIDPATGKAKTILSFRDSAPSGASKCALSAEAFHPVNVNSASPAVRLALCLAPLDFDNPAFSLQQAIDAAAGIRPSGQVLSITTNTDGSVIELAPGADDLTQKVPCLVSCGNYYVQASTVDATHLESKADLSGLAELSGHPLVLNTVLSHFGHLFTRSNPYKTSPLNDYLMAARRGILSFVSFDNYTVRAISSLRSPNGLERARWEITECVAIGGPRVDDAGPLPIDYRTASGDRWSWSSSSIFLHPQKCRFWFPWKMDHLLDALGFPETIPGSVWLSPALDSNCCQTPGGALMYFSTVSGGGGGGAGWNPPAPHVSRCQDPSGRIWIGNSERFFTYLREYSSLQYTSDRENGLLCANDVGTPFSPQQADIPFRGNFVVAGWYKAQGWEPFSDTTMHRIFSILPATEGTTGSTQLYVKDGTLSLRVEDDTGVAGTFSYRLTERNFPENAWMYIVCHIGGNQQGQCSIFVDNRPVPVEYSTTAPRSDGYSLRLSDNWPCTFPIISADSDGDPNTLDVSSTEGYPDTGYFRVEDEVVFYGAKTAISFLSLRRNVGGSKSSQMPSGAKVLPASAISTASSYWMNRPPLRGDVVSLVQYEIAAGTGYRAAGRDPQSMQLDLDAILDADTSANVLCAPANVSFSTTLPLSGPVMAFCGTSGTCCTGDIGTGRASIFWFSKPDISDGFVGDAGPQTIAHPDHSVFRLSTDLDASCTEMAANLFPPSERYYRCCLMLIDGEVLGVKPTYPGKPMEIERGMFGTSPAVHSRAAWAIPLEFYSVDVLHTDMSAELKSISDSIRISSSRRYWRLDDEILRACFDGPGFPPSSVPLFRGAFGSIPAEHKAGTLAVIFPCLAGNSYEVDESDGRQGGYLEFSRTRPGMRISGLTWADLAPDPFIQLHFWADVADDHDFVREPVSPNVFHFTSKSKDFSISRNGEPILTDNVTVRVMHEYLRGAWLPNDPTRHSWKVLPQIDEIELWIQEPDVVFEHREHP